MPELTVDFVAPPSSSGQAGDALVPLPFSARIAPPVAAAMVAADGDANAIKEDGAADAAAGVPFSFFGPPAVEVTLGYPAVGSTLVQWHSHGVWASDYTPDGSFLLSGGEEGVLVLWQLTAGAGAGGGAAGPVKDRRLMTYLPRLGAPIRCIASYAAGGHGAPFRASSSSAAAASHARTAPPLIFAIGCVDNTLVVVNGVSLKEMWRTRGMAIAGVPAAVPCGVAASLLRYARKHAAGRGLLPPPSSSSSTADGEGDAAAAESQGAAVLQLGGDRATMLSSASRYLTRGAVVDPRSRWVWGCFRRKSVRVFA